MVKYEFLLSQMFPIIGDRYRCTDCTEKIGFDLCSDCYTTGSKVPGRFNQQHTPEHKFEVVPAGMIRNIMLRLVTGHDDDASIRFIVNDASENSEDGSTEHFYFSGIAEENLEDSLVIPATSNDDGTEEDQGDSQTTNQI